MDRGQTKRNKVEKNDESFLFMQPIEMLKLIVHFLDKKDLDALALTSKWLYDFLHLNIPNAWKKVCFVRASRETILEVLHMKRHSKVESIEIVDSCARLKRLIELKFNLKILILHDNGIMPKGAKVIVKFLELNTLYYLDLYENKLSDEGTIIIAEILKVNKSLKWLNLARNSISQRGVKAIAGALKTNTTLTYLNLYFNKIGFGRESSAESLITNTVLKHLNLGSNYIGYGEAKAIAKALKVNTNLTELNLSYNLIPKGGMVISEALKINNTLLHLGYGANTVDDEGAAAIADALKFNTSLLYLNLRDNRIGDEGIKATAEMLKVNTSLKCVDFSRNPLKEEGLLKIVESLKINTTLKHFGFYDKNTELGIDEILKFNTGFDDSFIL